MALNFRPALRQAASATMTPQLARSIGLIQLSQAELGQFITAQLESNPFLKAESAAPAETSPIADAPGMADSVRQNPPQEAGMPSALSGPAAADRSMLAQTTPAPHSLAAHVSEQLALTVRRPEDLPIARSLADHLDPTGYLSATTGEVADQLNVPTARVEEVLVCLQEMEPAGLFARDLAECLAIQLRQRGLLSKAMRALLARLDLVARRDFKALQTHCGLNQAQVLRLLAHIRTTDPKPGNRFDAFKPQPVIPDILVTRTRDAAWRVELNEVTIPKILLDRDYFSFVRTHAPRAEDRRYLQNCLTNARWLIRSLDRRATTILRTAEEIVRRQTSFLERGIAELKPFTLKTIGDSLGLHESTVSRVAANKFMMTPRGLFELSYFFSGAVKSADGAKSARAVAARIGEMIEKESHEAVLSDAQIVDLLRQEGIEIARRTVTKYREGMGLASSVQRRRNYIAGDKFA